MIGGHAFKAYKRLISPSINELYRGFGSKKYQSLKEKQILSSKLGSNLVEEVEPEKQKVRVEIGQKSKIPTKIFQLMHLPIYSSFAYKLIQNGFWTDPMMIDLFTQINVLYFSYSLYYYLVVFYRNPSLLRQSQGTEPKQPLHRKGETQNDDKNGTSVKVDSRKNNAWKYLLKRTVFCFPYLLSAGILAGFGSKMGFLSMIITGNITIVASVALDVFLIVQERQVPHEDFKTKVLMSLFVFLISSFIVGYQYLQTYEETKKEELLLKYINMGKERTVSSLSNQEQLPQDK